MDFNEFTESIIEVLKQKLGGTCSITVTEVLKNNGIRRTGLVITGEENTVSPTVYLEEPYIQYQDGTPVGKIAEEIRAVYERQAGAMDLDVGFFKDFTLVEDRIFHKLINYEKNKELLKDVPHFRWHDLAVVFYYQMEEKIFGKATIMIHDSHLAVWELTAEEVYRVARRNMEQKKPEVLVPIQEVLKDMMGLQVEESPVPLYVLTNREKMFGASAMLYSEKIKELADRLQTDLLILPSSTHEVLLLPDEGEQDYTVYRQMVREVNTTQVDPEEILSFNVYRYDRKRAMIEEAAA